MFNCYLFDEINTISIRYGTPFGCHVQFRSTDWFLFIRMPFLTCTVLSCIECRRLFHYFLSNICGLELSY